MELIFVFLAIIFAIVSAINSMKKKENQQPAPVKVMRRVLFELAGEHEEQPGAAREKQRESLLQPGWSGTGQTSEQPRDYNAGVSLQPEPDKMEAEARTGGHTGLVKMLSSTDSLVTAFIFHEIIERPRAWRQR